MSLRECCSGRCEAPPASLISFTNCILFHKYFYRSRIFAVCISLSYGSLADSFYSIVPKLFVQNTKPIQKKYKYNTFLKENNLRKIFKYFCLFLSFCGEKYMYRDEKLIPTKIVSPKITILPIQQTHTSGREWQLPRGTPNKKACAHTIDSISRGAQWCLFS